MATVKELKTMIDEMSSEIAQLVEEREEFADRMTDMENQLGALTDKLEAEVEKVVKTVAEKVVSKGTTKRQSNLSEEQRKAAGERLQMGRAQKLGLDSIEQLRALKLRPGQTPTKAEIDAVKKEFPAGKAETPKVIEKVTPKSRKTSK